MRKISGKKSSKSSGRKVTNTKLYLGSGVLMIALFFAVSQVQLPQNSNSRAQATAITNCDVTPDQTNIDSEEQKLFDMINDYRERNGAVRLKMSPNLTRAATWLAADMNRSGRLDHTDSTGRGFALRIVECGYDGNSSAENISNRAATADLVLEGWAASPPHNMNMLSTRFTVAGIARVGGWWALDFGSTDDSNAAPLPSSSAPAPTSAVVPSVVIPSSQPVQPTIAPTIPPGGVPNPGCLSPTCPTIVPNQPGTNQPPTTISQAPGPDTPTSPNDPNPDGPDTPEEPDEELPEPEKPPAEIPESNGNNEGLIGFLIEFIKLILEFFQKLFN